MVESTALEMRRTGNRTVGSNPTLSASHRSSFDIRQRLRKRGHKGMSAATRRHGFRVASSREPGCALQSRFGTRRGQILFALQHFARGERPSLNPAIKQVLTIFVGTKPMFRSPEPSQDLTNMKNKYMAMRPMCLRESPSYPEKLTNKSLVIEQET